MAATTLKTRKFSRLTDEQVIWLFALAHYRLAWRGELAFVENRGGRRLQVLADKGGYRFTRLYDGRWRRAMPLHVLVWLLEHRRAVPDNCQVHHRRGLGHERICDLELLTARNHRRAHEDPWD